MATKTLDCASHHDALAIALAELGLRTRLIDQALALISTQTAGDEAKRAVLALLMALAPRNYLEATLALQIIGTHEAAMDCFGRAAAVGQKKRAFVMSSCGTPRNC